MGDTRKLQKTRHPGVYRTPNGQILIRWTLRHASGKRSDHEETLDAGVSLESAVATRARKIEEARRSDSQAPEKQLPPTIGAFAASWLARKRPRMKLRAAESYAQILTDWVLPFLGHIRIDELRRSHLETWLGYVEEWGYRRARAREPRPFEPVWMQLVSRETLKGWWGKLKHVLRDACAECGLRDVTERIEGPRAHGRPTVHEQRTLSPEEIQAVFAELPPQWRLEVLTDSLSGMRPGELYELQWDRDVDLVRGMITISRSHARGVVGPTKTGKIKSVPIGPDLLEALRAHRERQLRDQGEALATGLVFPASEAGRTNWRRTASALRNALERAGRHADLDVRVTPQVLRRSFNTLLKDRGITPEAIQAMMGHSTDGRMTARYYHARDEVKRAAVVDLEARLATGRH